MSLAADVRFVARVVPVLMLLTLAGGASAVVPGQVDFQGLLLDDQGQPATGVVDLAFELYDAPAGGSLLWSETLLDVPLVDGVYSVTLGETTPLTPAILSGSDLHLEITVEAEVLSPRRALLAVPYAVRAAEADSLGGTSSDFFTGMIESFDFDGGAPPNTDPSEGTADVDGDGRMNFVDNDNDDDGILDRDEVDEGSDINLVTPTLVDTTPDPIERNVATLVSVTGTNFVAGITADLEGVPVLPMNTTSTSMDLGLTPLLEGPNALTVMRPNGETASIDVEAIRIIPTITDISVPGVETGVATPITVFGTNFVSGIAVDFGGVPAAPSNVTATSFDVTLTGLADGVVTLTVTRPSGELATFPVPVGLRLVFTLGATNGNLGGAAGADADCAAQAVANSYPGTFMAWISDSTTDPASRFTQSGGPFVRPDGTIIANDWADLTDGTLDNPISASAISAWTATSTSGSWLNNGQDCQDWSSSGVSNMGARGQADFSDSRWTHITPAISCSGSLVLYCFQQ